jgi:hypothetical protein
MRWTVWPAVLLSLLATAGGAVAQNGLELIDGRVLEGVAVERVKGGYELQLDSGARVVIPAELVLQVRLAVEPSRAPTPEADLTEAPVPEPAVEELPETPSLPDATRQPFEQLAVFGPQRADVAQGVVDASWRPSSDLRQELVENEFDPSSWTAPVVGSRWTPEDSLDRGADWSRSPSAKWARSSIRSTWWPGQGSSGLDAGPEFD